VWYTLLNDANSQTQSQARSTPRLELLAASRDGCTEAMMLAHGFTIDDMVAPVRAGLATATAERDSKI
jgi:hypothetical protein